MKIKSTLAPLAGFTLVGFLWVGEATAQRGRGAGGGGRSAGHRSAGSASQQNRSPSMSRPSGGGGTHALPPTGRRRRRDAATRRYAWRCAAAGRGPAGEIQRRTHNPAAEAAAGRSARWRSDRRRPGDPARGARRRVAASGRGAAEAALEAKAGAQPGRRWQPAARWRGAGNRPGASSDQLSDFLGMQGPDVRRSRPEGGRTRQSARWSRRVGMARNDLVETGGGGVASATDLVESAASAVHGVGNHRWSRRRRRSGGVGNRPDGVGGVGNSPNIGDRNIAANTGNRNATNVNVGNVNVGNSVNYADNRQAWVSQRQNWGNGVRGSVGNRYNNVFNDAWYRRPYAGAGYNYSGGWAARGPHYAWTPAAWTGVGRGLAGPGRAPSPPTTATARGATSITRTTLSTSTARPPARPSSITSQPRRLPRRLLPSTRPTPRTSGSPSESTP